MTSSLKIECNHDVRHCVILGCVQLVRCAICTSHCVPDTYKGAVFAGFHHSTSGYQLNIQLQWQKIAKCKRTFWTNCFQRAKGLSNNYQIKLA